MATLNIPNPSLATPSPRPNRLGKPWHVLLILCSLGGGLWAWDTLVRVQQLPAFILPLPSAVWEQFLEVLASGKLLWHTQITLVEVLGGLALGLTTAFSLGYLIAKSPALESLLTPYLVASQAVPIVAIAPLLVIWLGIGLQSKIFICALIVFFPVLVNTIHGLRSVEPDLRDLMRSLRANRWQVFLKLELPAALPTILNSLKVGATLAVIGAVVGEFVGSDRGLGSLVNQGLGRYETALAFVGVGMLVLLALTLYGSVSILEKFLLKWKG